MYCAEDACGQDFCSLHEWECPACTLRNKPNDVDCAACQHTRLGDLTVPTQSPLSHMPAIFVVIHTQSKQQAIDNVQLVVDCQDQAQQGPVAGVFLINDGQGVQTLQTFAPVVQAVRNKFPKLWMGVNLLHTRLDPVEAFREMGVLAKSCCLEGLWCDWAWIDEKSPLEKQKFARQAYLARQQSGWKGVYFGGVAFKGNPNYALVKDFKQAGEIARYFVDVVTTTDSESGVPPTVAKVEELKSGCGDVAVAIASGISAANIGLYRHCAQAFLVATNISRSHYQLDPVKLRALVKAAGGTAQEEKKEVLVSLPFIAAPQEIKAVADLIRSGKVKRFAFLTGAGVSVASGIPDFRSPGGLYATLNPSLLTATEEQKAWMRRDPTMVVNWKLFKVNQFPYLEVRKPFILGSGLKQWKATLGHWFIRVCHDEGLLVRLYTQNIDGLDNQTGIPDDLMVPVHGSLGKTSCEGCGASYPQDKFIKAVQTNIKDIYNTGAPAPAESSPIPCNNCKQPLVKPSTVLYGRSMPEAFSVACDQDFDGEKVDLLIIMGTSLTVGPANMIPSFVSGSCKRVFVNMEDGGEFSERTCNRNGRDFFFKGEIDQSIKTLCDLLGWTDKLRAFADKMCPASASLLEKK